MGSTSIYSEKAVLRKLVRERVNSYTPERLLEFSEIILKKLENTRLFIESKNILAYWSMPSEVFTHDFIIKWSSSKNFYLPVVTNNNLDIRKFTNEQNMITSSKFNIQEPVGGKLTNLGIIDLTIVPGIAFDKNNNRLGRGRGYYDRLLINIKEKKVGICFFFQFFDSIPVDANDIPVDAVISFNPEEKYI